MGVRERVFGMDRDLARMPLAGVIDPRRCAGWECEWFDVGDGWVAGQRRVDHGLSA